MSIDFTSIHNHNEHSVFDRVLSSAAKYPEMAADQELLADVACVALNRLPPRYIRHSVDLAFYLSESERESNERAVDAAVTYAFDFVRSRSAARVRC